jgi:hypothetical protein
MTTTAHPMMMTTTSLLKMTTTASLRMMMIPPQARGPETMMTPRVVRVVEALIFSATG